MTRGRRPIPTHLKVLRGNPGKRALPENEPQPKGNLFEPPDFLSEAQRVRWNYAIATSPPGLLKRTDRDILTAWVVAADLHAIAVVKQTEIDAGSDVPLLARVGGTVNADGARIGGTLQQSPYLPIINRQAQIMSRLVAELGFSPSARTRISLGAAPDETPDNEFAEFG